jgi:hypothetical protein
MRRLCTLDRFDLLERDFQKVFGLCVCRPPALLDGNQSRLINHLSHETDKPLQTG